MEQKFWQCLDGGRTLGVLRKLRAWPWVLGHSSQKEGSRGLASAWQWSWAYTRRYLSKLSQSPSCGLEGRGLWIVLCYPQLTWSWETSSTGPGTVLGTRATSSQQE